MTDEYVISTAEDETIYVWKMQSGALVATLPGHRACLFPDGRILTWSAHWSNF